MNQTTINEFQASWSHFDDDGNGYINVEELDNLILNLIETNNDLIPMKKRYKNEKYREMFIARLKLPTYYKFTSYYFFDVLNALCKEVYELEFV